MTNSDKRSFSVGQAVSHHGAPGEIVAVSEDGISARVTFPYSPSKRPGWFKVDELQIRLVPTTPDVDDDSTLYPVDALLTNEAGEVVRVIGRWKSDVKLQAGSGANLTDFQPAGEPFTISEEDVEIWLQKAYKPGDVVELVDGRIERLLKMALNKEMTDAEQREYLFGLRYGSQVLRQDDWTPYGVGSTHITAIKGKFQIPVITPYTWIVGQRARLLEDLPDELWALYEGDEGTVIEASGELGFKSDRYGSSSMTRLLNGKIVRVLDHCEAIVADSLTPSPDLTPSPSPTGEGSQEPDVNEHTFKALQGENKQLQRSLESAHFDLKLLNRERDAMMGAIEDAGKLAAALEDAEKRIRRLEKQNQQLASKNEQQSEMLRAAANNPTLDGASDARRSPIAHASHIYEEGSKRLQTLMTIGGGNGLGEVSIPHGWEIAAITTEVYHTGSTPQLVRLVHLIGCNPDTPNPLRGEQTERIPEFNRVTIHSGDETVMPQNAEQREQDEYETALKSGMSPDEVIHIGNQRVVELAWQTAQLHRGERQAHPAIPSRFIGEG